MVGVATALITLCNYNHKRARRVADNECRPSPYPVAAASGVNVEVHRTVVNAPRRRAAGTYEHSGTPSGPPPRQREICQNQHAHNVPV